jgi:predicted nucleic acid-binding protein
MASNAVVVAGPDCSRPNVTPCDSAYVALAEELGCDLLTADQRLARATGPRRRPRVLQ